MSTSASSTFEQSPIVAAASWGHPLDGNTYSGIPRTVFSELARSGKLVSTFDLRPNLYRSLKWGRYRFSGWSAGFWPKGWNVWRYLPGNIERVSRHWSLSGAAEEADVVFQFGVSGLPPEGIPLLAHIEYPIASVFENEVFAKNYGFTGLSDEVMAQAIEGERIFTDQCDLVWTNTPFTSTLLEKSGVTPEKIRVLTPPGNFQESDLGERDWSRKRILFVGRNWSVKGGDHLVRAFEILREAMGDASLVIIGCIPPRSVRDVDGVECLGYLSMNKESERSRLIEEYRKATVFCMPSRTESTGMVFMEAAQAGLPVIMRRIPETDALYPDDLFKKVEGDSPEELAELLRQDLENEAAIAERAARARRFLVENYGPEIFLRKISEQIREAAVIGQE